MWTDLEEFALGTAAARVLVLVLGDDRGSLADLAPAESLVLGPLDLAAVHAIALRYVPGHASTDVPAQRLLQESQGVPSRVHGLAREWARREAARRVKAGAERAALGRLELRSMEVALADDVVELEVASQAVSPAGRERDAHRLPVQGSCLLPDGRRPILLRSRAPCRRVDRSAGGRAAAWNCRAIGERQVIGAAGRPAPGVGRGGAAGK